ncbi:Carboxynorspermidine decarboxylase (EC 4.1.1.96) [Methylomonas albis]|uniref:Carboxynorspermidine/carboxyspermidine decarboxylase n=1 Tax=Methylomonas albis TaxID=1854563 RepID=A0ABR9CYF1_9GAMM|nr:carboxynorspermidine decarboxylase [Methylomonas albis]MBD9355551.1 carboxynorspermidine decarboxylase [Methylomonas albis]CAD6878557.1 Carboxynorspermidine decarboxylase (EC 4.1.1.96) [Methylomonas albis]
MNWTDLKQQIQTSPAFVLDEDQVLTNLQPLLALRRATGCKLLYAMKALPLASLLALIKDQVDGMSVSSLFEARLAKEVLQETAGSLHLTTPGIRPDEFSELGRLCSHISFNSLSQYQGLQALADGYSTGLRVNPKLSFANDPRYDPCRPHSKLGVDIALLQDGLATGIEGLHFHTVFACRDFMPLQQTLEKLRPILKRSPLKWLNLGGGYLYNGIANHAPIVDLISGLRAEFDVEVYLEPGKAVVGNAGYLLTTVLDRFASDGKQVLILDTSVNHHPEVFEYQMKPRLLEEDTAGEQSAILAGSTCLAGDVFGEYRFGRIPEVGERLVFADVGAYSLIKANRFNGYNLPDVYSANPARLVLQKRYSYADYRRQWTNSGD